MDNQLIQDLQLWIKNYVEQAHANGIVVGMSGGKDSLVVAKLCVNAIGKEKVFGVIMPNGEMSDKNDAVKACEIIGINYSVVSIADAYNRIIESIKDTLSGLNTSLNDVTMINTAPRIRMTTLYAVAGSLNYLVANTSNLSEASVGYSTKWGDGVGDFAPLQNFTKTEVCQMGILLDLPDDLVNKVPSDGLSGKSDEDKLGFTYAELDDYIRKGIKGDNFSLIEKKHKISKHKRDGITKFPYNKENYFNK